MAEIIPLNGISITDHTGKDTIGTIHKEDLESLLKISPDTKDININDINFIKAHEVSLIKAGDKEYSIKFKPEIITNGLPSSDKTNFGYYRLHEMRMNLTESFMEEYNMGRTVGYEEQEGVRLFDISHDVEDNILKVIRKKFDEGDENKNLSKRKITSLRVKNVKTNLLGTYVTFKVDWKEANSSSSDYVKIKINKNQIRNINTPLFGNKYSNIYKRANLNLPKSWTKMERLPKLWQNKGYIFGPEFIKNNEEIEIKKDDVVEANILNEDTAILPRAKDKLQRTNLALEQPYNPSVVNKKSSETVRSIEEEKLSNTPLDYLSDNINSLKDTKIEYPQGKEISGEQTEDDNVQEVSDRKLNERADEVKNKIKQPPSKFRIFINNLLYTQPITNSNDVKDIKPDTQQRTYSTLPPNYNPSATRSSPIPNNESSKISPTSKNSNGSGNGKLIGYSLASLIAGIMIGRCSVDTPKYETKNIILSSDLDAKNKKLSELEKKVHEDQVFYTDRLKAKDDEIAKLEKYYAACIAPKVKANKVIKRSVPPTNPVPIITQQEVLIDGKIYGKSKNTDINKDPLYKKYSAELLKYKEEHCKGYVGTISVAYFVNDNGVLNFSKVKKHTHNKIFKIGETTPDVSFYNDLVKEFEGKKVDDKTPQLLYKDRITCQGDKK